MVVHERNRGINPARHTGIVAARGEWVVVVDSDWELLPDALERLRAAIDGLPEGVRVVRYRLLWDDGAVTPALHPCRALSATRAGSAGSQEEGGNDAGRCIHRRGPRDDAATSPSRRGAMETLFELDLARGRDDPLPRRVLGKEHSDAPNSWLRTAEAAELLPRLRSEAPDMLWMAETTLQRHGEALRRSGPSQYATMLRVAAVQAFLLGQRRDGIRHALRALRRRPLEPLAWVTLVLGLLGPGAVARGDPGAAPADRLAGALGRARRRRRGRAPEKRTSGRRIVASITAASRNWLPVQVQPTATTPTSGISSGAEGEDDRELDALDRRRRSRPGARSGRRRCRGRRSRWGSPRARAGAAGWCPSRRTPGRRPAAPAGRPAPSAPPSGRPAASSAPAPGGESRRSRGMSSAASTVSEVIMLSATSCSERQIIQGT